MAIGTLFEQNTEAAILTRIVQPDRDNLSESEAKALLRFDFDRADLDRIHELAVKNQADVLTTVEREELEVYLRLSSLLDLMHAKAHSSLGKRT